MELRIVVADAESGAARILTGDSEGPLGVAVAASCAVPGIWPPVTIGDRRYVDGGIRSSTNADLAAEHDGVDIVAAHLVDLDAEPLRLKLCAYVLKELAPVLLGPIELLHLRPHVGLERIEFRRLPPAPPSARFPVRRSCA